MIFKCENLNFVYVGWMRPLPHFFISHILMLIWECTVLQVNVMLKKLPEEDFGPGIDFREYSIFDNPSLPSEVNNAMILVSLIMIFRFLIYLLCLNLFALVLEFRWKSHGLMFSSVKKELKIVMDHIIPLLEEYLNFQGIAMKKWYLIFFSSLYYISQIMFNANFLLKLF